LPISLFDIFCLAYPCGHDDDTTNARRTRTSTKISENLVFEYDRAAMMKPWRIRTAATERIDLLFEPEFERISENGTPDSYFVNTHQMFGRYSGRITPDNGGAVELRDLFGWIEDHKARW
jgi:Protein of unknown function (DUF2804).